MDYWEAMVPGLGNRRRALSKRLAVEIDQPRLFKEIDSIHELNGVRMVYIDHEYTDVTLRDFQPGCHKLPFTLVLWESPRGTSAKNFAAHVTSNQRDSKLIGELVGMSLSCSAAVLSWLVILGSGIAIPFTGGTSAALTYLGYAAATASAVQCANGTLRSYAEIKNPQLNDWLDSKEWYTNTAMAVDAVSLAGVGASTVMLARIGQTLKSASSRSTIEVLKGMTRAERKRLTQEIIKLNHPGVSGKVMKLLIAGGKYPKRYTQGQISQALTLKVQEAVGASISFIGSASSGVVKSIAVGIYERTVDL